ncbi:hypothetical protein [Coleofasciculus sp. E1-EBD-02]|uniref:hypothetical protein n=1 Tax=Coleofasciculus sp. E1-EBD-02 TaxID=3068481 RepID=UPI0032FE5698
MIWLAKSGSETPLQLEVGDDMLEWLKDQIDSYAIEQIDLYGDTVLDRKDQSQILKSLNFVFSQWSESLRKKYTTSTVLPRNPDVRECILKDLISKELRKHPYFQNLMELEAFLELSLELGFTVYAVGN